MIRRPRFDRRAVVEPGPARRIAGLAVVTLLMVIIAIFAVSTERQSLSSRFEPRPMFPDLADQVNDASKVVVKSRTKTATILRDGSGPDASWHVEEKAGFPARPQMVKRTVVGLAELQLVAPRTAQPEWHRHLALRAPEDKGAGVHITIYNEADEVLADLIVGKVDEDPSATGRKGRIYVRRAGEDQAYLAEGSFNLEQNVDNWLATDVLDMERGRVSLVEVTPPEGRSFSLVLSGDGSGQTPAYVFGDLPDGYTVRTDYALSGVGNALAALSLTDVAPRADIAFDAPTVSRYITRDGLVITVTAEKIGGAHWARFEAGTEDGASDEVVAEAARLNKRLGPWAFQLSSFKGIDLTRDFDALAAPEGEVQPGERVTVPEPQ